MDNLKNLYKIEFIVLNVSIVTKMEYSINIKANRLENCKQNELMSEEEKIKEKSRNYF